MESISSKSRIRGIIGYQTMYGLGGLVLVLAAYFIRDYRYLQLALVAPLVPMIAYRWYVRCKALDIPTISELRTTPFRLSCIQCT